MLLVGQLRRLETNCPAMRRRNGHTRCYWKAGDILSSSSDRCTRPSHTELRPFVGCPLLVRKWSGDNNVAGDHYCGDGGCDDGCDGGGDGGGDCVPGRHTRVLLGGLR
ncbi:hypothetical protein LSAT2_000102 [Lamellibrachia satsuma]|nr:hypothetical protein LSAT2_000102 [Lamellibrachia satsuma]